ncbi:MAG: hypothetical protein FWE36_01340 [Erysipelotrichales bacterium]|nr:hypothetical protein [Erysipelotrichales bacterium]
MKLKDLNSLEKKLIKKYSPKKENEINLLAEDFRDGRLTMNGYIRLKQQCEYIPYREEVEIKIPKDYEAYFKDRLEYLGSAELMHIKNEIRDTRKLAVIFFLVGTIFFMFGMVFELYNVAVIKDLIIIISWVFVWVAVEKWFFDQKDQSENRRNILRIIYSKVTTNE